MADAPNLGGSSFEATIHADEDSIIPLQISSDLVDSDGSESLVIYLDGLPAGVTPSNGSPEGDGSWVLQPEDLNNLNLSLPANFNENFDVTVVAESREANSSSTETVSKVISIDLNAVADSAALKADNASGLEDSPIALTIDAELSHSNATETLSIEISGLPTGASLSAGTLSNNGTWVLEPNELTDLTIMPPPHSHDPFTINVAAISAEPSNGDVVTVDQTLSITVTPVPDDPLVSVTAAQGSEDNAVRLNIAPALVDTDGSETLGPVTISGLPAGASLNQGVLNGDGSYTLTPAELDGLQLNPPPDSNEDFSLSVTATSIETDTGASASTQLSLPISLTGVADTPIIDAQDISGKEDRWVRLDVDSTLTDTDGSETLTFVVDNVPKGAKLDVGELQNDGSWHLSTDQLSVVKIKPPAHFSGEFDLQITAVATENDGDSAQQADTFTVNVEAVVDTLKISRKTAVGKEDEAIEINVSVALRDKDGSETIADEVIISAVPDDAALSHGIKLEDGSWRLSLGDLENLTVTPGADNADDFVMKIHATALEANGASRVTTQSIPVKVQAQADAPAAEIIDAAGFEDQAIVIKADAVLLDTDGSESLSIQIHRVPAGANLSVGTYLGDGTWQLAPDDLANLSITPPPNFSGTIELEFDAIATELEGHTSHTILPFSVEVAGVADTPHWEVRPASGYEDNSINLDIRTQLLDTDGSESLHVEIANVPSGAVLSHGTESNGTWIVQQAELSNLSIVPPMDSNEDFVLDITAVVTESDGDVSRSTKSLPVAVKGVADVPIVAQHDVTGYEDSVIQLNLDAALKDVDGSESISFVIGGLKPGMTISHGVYNGDGTWSLEPADLAQVSITPPRDFSGDIALSLKAISTENDGDSTSITVPVKLHVVGVVDNPNAFRSASGLEDNAIAIDVFQTAGDIDGSESLVSAQISNLPDGAVLSAGTEVSPGVYEFSPLELDNLTVTPPLHSNENFALNVSIKIVESDGAEKTFVGPLKVNVVGVADVPTISATDVSGDTNNLIPLDFEGQLVDSDVSA
ncbi:MAG: hypothetical protein AAF387_20195, partial [Pseudomonadota bacterium]